jgi:hypothetical protein
MTDPTQQSLEVTRKQAHPDCISCSLENASGLALEFCVRDDKGVQAEFACSQIYQGYPVYVLEAEIEQKGQTLVRGSAKFIDRDL